MVNGQEFLPAIINMTLAPFIGSKKRDLELAQAGQEKTQVCLSLPSNFDLGQVKKEVWWPSGQVKLASAVLKCGFQKRLKT